MLRGACSSERVRDEPITRSHLSVQSSTNTHAHAPCPEVRWRGQAQSCSSFCVGDRSNLKRAENRIHAMMTRLSVYRLLTLLCLYAARWTRKFQCSVFDITLTFATLCPDARQTKVFAPTEGCNKQLLRLQVTWKHDPLTRWRVGFLYRFS